VKKNFFDEKKFVKKNFDKRKVENWTKIAGKKAEKRPIKPL